MRYSVLYNNTEPISSYRSSRPQNKIGSMTGYMEPAFERDISPPRPWMNQFDISKKDLQDLYRDPAVVDFAPVMPIELIEPFDSQLGNNELSQSTWAFAATKVDVTKFDGRGTKIAILDTGIDSSHSAFNGVSFNEKDFTGEGNGDKQGHGTHCAGTAFGRDVNGIRIGVARGVQEAYIGKVIGKNNASSAMLFDAIQWTLENDVDVVSMSLGFDFPGFVDGLVKNDYPVDLATSIALNGYTDNIRMFDRLMALSRARSVFGSGTIFVAAGGNESKRDINENYEIGISIPAKAEGIISVGALANSLDGYKVAPFSNTGPVLSAPGVDIVSAKKGGGLISYSGTSMACPHVAGITALWWQALKSQAIPLNPQAVKARLRSSCRTNVFEKNVDIEDRGAGIVTAP